MEVLRPKGVAADIHFPLVDKGLTDFDSGCTFVAGDVKVSKDGAAFANTSNLPSHIGAGIYKLTLTASEMNADRIAVVVVDQTSPRDWEDQAILIATYADTYQAKVWLIDDDSGTTDRYLVAFFKNGMPLAAASITSPQIQVFKAADGNNLIAATALAQIGAQDAYRYDATGTSRVTGGAGYIARVTATIDGATRTWLQPVGRDSA